jgi:hypothetical protein
MKVPWTLRWALAWAALTGRYITISMDSNPQWGTTFRFDVEKTRVKRWLKRRDRLRAKRGAS